MDMSDSDRKHDRLKIVPIIASIFGPDLNSPERLFFCPYNEGELWKLQRSWRSMKLITA